MKSCPADPSELVALLTDIFPGFAPRRESDQGEVDSYHSVFLFDFNPYFGKHAPEFEEKQLKALSRLLANCLNAKGSIQNAVETCFLEHVSQMGVTRYVLPYLKTARTDRIS